MLPLVLISLILLILFFYLLFFKSGHMERRLIVEALRASTPKPLLMYSARKNLLGSPVLMIAAEAGLKNKWEAYRVMERLLLNIQPKMRRLRTSPFELSVEVHFSEDSEKKGVLVCDLRKYAQDITPIEFLYKESCIVAKNSPVLVPTHLLKKEEFMKELLRTIC